MQPLQRTASDVILLDLPASVQQTRGRCGGSSGLGSEAQQQTLLKPLSFAELTSLLHDVCQLLSAA